jgi:transcriptional regulator with XRE-family HTH domain
MTSLRRKPYSPIRRTDRNTVGKTVERLRKAQSLTRDELSARAQIGGWEISPYVLKRIESGEREVTDIELKKLAKALRVPVAVLLE